MYLLHVLVGALACLLSYGECRDVNKTSRTTLPTISNSLVNLGKMEISFYFGKPDPTVEKSDKSPIPSLSSFSSLSSFPFPLPFPMVPKSTPEEEPCPCTQFTSKADSILSKPSEIINKILMSNDLFKNPTSSFCCDSHEQAHESTFFFELSPNQASQPKLPFKLPPPTLNLNSLKPSSKPKTLEIFLFPKRKDLANFDFTKLAPTKDVSKNIEKVGKEVTFDLPINNMKMTVKKDLTDLEKKQKKEDINVTENKVFDVSTAATFSA